MSQTSEKSPLLSGNKIPQSPGNESENVPLSSQALVRFGIRQGWGYRHILAGLSFLGFFNVYCMRVNLSVAIVAMVNTTTSSKNSSDACPGDVVSNSTPAHEPEFDWSSDTQGYILGSFFYGYILTQIPGGWLAEKYGGKYLFGFGVLCTAVFTLLTPVAARFSVAAFIVLRVLEGLGEGVTFPAMHAMWGKWAPLYERSKLVAFCYAGAQLGTVFALPISGILCDHGFAGGWPSVFYVFGAFACVWFILWMMIIYNTPAEHPRISVVEREYIEQGVGVKEDLATPWREIFSSTAVWAICIAHVSNNWGFYTMLTTLPSYMTEILKFDLKTNGFISALPYFGCWVGQNFSGFLADYLRGHGYLSTHTTRRALTVFGLGVPGILMICIQFAGCNHTVAVALLVMCLTFGGFTMGGFQVNHIDLSPNFAGVLMGMSNTFATIPGFLGPQIVGWLTAKHNTRGQWQLAFYICAAVYLSGAVLYFFMSKGTVQSWNEPTRGVTFTRKIKTASQESTHTQYSSRPPGIIE